MRIPYGTDVGDVGLRAAEIARSELGDKAETPLGRTAQQIIAIYPRVPETGPHLSRVKAAIEAVGAKTPNKSFFAAAAHIAQDALNTAYNMGR